MHVELGGSILNKASRFLLSCRLFPLEAQAESPLLSAIETISQRQLERQGEWSPKLEFRCGLRGWTGEKKLVEVSSP